MRITTYLVLLVSMLVVLSSPAVLCQENVLETGDSRAEMQIGYGTATSQDNQTWVREYDGRHFVGPNINQLSYYGYKNSGIQFWLNARDLFVGDSDVGLGFAGKDRWSMSAGTSSLTHRLGSYPANTPWLAGQLRDLGFTFTGAKQGDTWGSFIDRSPDAQFSIDRQVNDLKLYVNANPASTMGLALRLWQEREVGQQQANMRAREATNHAGLSTSRFYVGALPIDRETSESNMGTDLVIGNTVLNYRFVCTNLSNGNNIAHGSALDYARPGDSLTIINSLTRGRVVKLRSKITEKLELTGVNISKQRTSDANNITTATTVGSGNARVNRVSNDSTNVALNFRPMDTLSFMGRWSRATSDNQVPFLYTTSNLVVPYDVTTSGDRTSYEFEGVYTGIRRTFLRLGLEQRNLTRKQSDVFPNVDEDDSGFRFPFTSPSTKWSIMRGALRYSGISNLNVSANYETWRSGNSGFSGMPNNKTKATANATYMLRDNIVVYGDISSLRESNNQIRVDPVPTSSVNATAQEEREWEAPGQSMKNETTTTSLGAWYSVNEKLTLDANVGWVASTASNMWILGVSNSNPEYTGIVPIDSHNNQWTTSANYVLNNRFTVRGGFTSANTDGATTVDSAQFAGLGPKWAPIGIKQAIWSVGLGYGLSKKDRVDLEFSNSNWKDEVDSANTGNFQLYRLTWARTF